MSGYADLDLKADYLEPHDGAGTTISVLVNAASGGRTAQDRVSQILGGLFEPVPRTIRAVGSPMGEPSKIRKPVSAASS